MGKKTVTQVEEAQRDPSRMNPRRNMPRHTVITLTKIYIYIYKSNKKHTWESPQDYQLTFFSRNSAGQKGLTLYKVIRDFLMVQWLRLTAFNVGGQSWIPGQGI